MIDPQKFPPLDLPIFEPKVRIVSEQVQIFDEVRKKYLVLTPEEWVRQHIVNFLVTEKSVPASLIKLEYQIKIGRVNKRPDVAVVHPDGSTWLLIECKAPDVSINKKVLEQAVNYFSVEQPKFMLLTNGIDHVYCEHKPTERKIVLIQDLPNFELK